MITPNWPAYYKTFSRAHGDNPVEVGNRILFRDVWMYAMDYAGPEWPPPADPIELLKLQREYWKRRRDKLKSRRDAMAASLQSLVELQQGKSLPLQHSVAQTVIQDDGSHLMVAMPEEINWDTLRLQIKELNEDLLECERELAALGLGG